MVRREEMRAHLELIISVTKISIVTEAINLTPAGKMFLKQV
jgi:hypothetical protein